VTVGGMPRGPHWKQKTIARNQFRKLLEAH